MEKFKVTFKAETIELRDEEVEDESVIAVLEKARIKAKELTATQTPGNVKTIWTVVAVKSL